MSEICLKCYNEETGENLTEADVIIDRHELDLCESCGEYKPCIIRYRNWFEKMVYRLFHWK